MTDLDKLELMSKGLLTMDNHHIKDEQIRTILENFSNTIADLEREFEEKEQYKEDLEYALNKIQELEDENSDLQDKITDLKDDLFELDTTRL